MAIWPQLLPELELRVLSFLDPNELAGTLRLVNKAAAALLPCPKHATIRLSQRVPPHAFAHHWGPPGAMRSLTYKERLQLLCLTAASGSIPNLELLLPRVGCLPTSKGAAVAAAAGQPAMCEWLRQRGCPCDGDTAEAAGHANCKEVYESLLAAGCPAAAHRAAAGAARGGHAGLLEWLLPRFEPRPDQLLPCVAEGCDLAALQRLHAALLGPGSGAEGLGGGPAAASAARRVVAAAAGSPTPDWRAKVEWLLAAGYPRCTAACTAAAERPDALERLPWLRARGFPLHTAVPCKASWMAGAAQLEALERLLGEGAPPGRAPGVDHRELGLSAAKLGRLEVLRALHERSHVDAVAVHAAAAAGHLPAVAWALGALDPAAVRPERLLGNAARSGSVELLAWLRERGFAWGGQVYDGAAGGGCEEALEWLAAAGCPMEAAASSAYETACFSCDLATLACLRRLGCPWSADVFTRVVGNAAPVAMAGACPLPALRWMVDNGCPVDWEEALEEARHWRQLGRAFLIESDMQELVAWLEEGRRQAAAGQHGG